MTKLTIIFPEYKDFNIPLGEVVLMYPETETTPGNQVQIIKTWLNLRKLDATEYITIVSVSPYIIEAAIKYSEKINKDIKMVFSDGKNISENDATPIFKLMAQPMRDMFLIK